MKFIIAILIFSMIILFHELGHFLLAKKNKIKVNEFCLGLGPTLFGIQKGETFYSIKLLPFGGACMMEGEDGESADECAFGSKSVWARMSVVAAGPIFNFILAYVLSFILISCIGVDVPVLSGVVAGYSAQSEGMQAGDVIVEINNKPIHFYREVSMYTYFHPGETLDVTYERDGKRHQAVIEPKYDEKSGRYMMVTGKVSANELSGPVGIVKSIGDTYDASKSDGMFYVFLNMLNFSILLTANLGVMNLLPLPALDGGRLVFLIIEAVRRKKINPEKEGMVHFVGIMILMGLMVLVMFNDIRKLFI